MKGVYALIIYIPDEIDITAGALGRITLVQGNYVYVGSAMGTGSTSLENRLARHFSDTKTVHWHIDYLLKADVGREKVVWAKTDKSMECDVAERMKSCNDFEQGPLGFGASDCTRNCGTHLFRQCAEDNTAETLEGIFQDSGLIPHTTSKMDFLQQTNSPFSKG